MYFYKQSTKATAPIAKWHGAVAFIVFCTVKGDFFSS
jgi:hypothetical protein